jgi:hypothetical protein
MSSEPPCLAHPAAVGPGGAASALERSDELGGREHMAPHRLVDLLCSGAGGEVMGVVKRDQAKRVARSSRAVAPRECVALKRNATTLTEHSRHGMLTHGT